MPQIDRYARSPLYAESLRLYDVAPNMVCVFVDLCRAEVQPVRIGSDWRIVPDGTKWPKSGYTVVADEDNGLAIDLCDAGIYPHSDGSWSQHRFAVRSTDEEKITDLYHWLKDQQHTKVAEKLAKQFPYLTTILDEDFWERVNEHLGLCAS